MPLKKSDLRSFSGALDKASKKTRWTEDDDLTCQLDEDLDDG